MPSSRSPEAAAGVAPRPRDPDATGSSPRRASGISRYSNYLRQVEAPRGAGARKSKASAGGGTWDDVKSHIMGGGASLRSSSSSDDDDGDDNDHKPRAASVESSASSVPLSLLRERIQQERQQLQDLEHTLLTARRKSQEAISPPLRTPSPNKQSPSPQRKTISPPRSSPSPPYAKPTKVSPPLESPRTPPHEHMTADEARAHIDATLRHDTHHLIKALMRSPATGGVPLSSRERERDKAATEAVAAAAAAAAASSVARGRMSPEAVAAQEAAAAVRGTEGSTVAARGSQVSPSGFGGVTGGSGEWGGSLPRPPSTTTASSVASRSHNHQHTSAPSAPTEGFYATPECISGESSPYQSPKRWMAEVERDGGASGTGAAWAVALPPSNKPAPHATNQRTTPSPPSAASFPQVADAVGAASSVSPPGKDFRETDLFGHKHVASSLWHQDPLQQRQGMSGVTGGLPDQGIYHSQSSLQSPSPSVGKDPSVSPPLRPEKGVLATPVSVSRVGDGMSDEKWGILSAVKDVRKLLLKLENDQSVSSGKLSTAGDRVEVLERVQDHVAMTCADVSCRVSRVEEAHTIARADAEVWRSEIVLLKSKLDLAFQRIDSLESVLISPQSAAQPLDTSSLHAPSRLLSDHPSTPLPRPQSPNDPAVSSSDSASTSLHSQPPPPPQPSFPSRQEQLSPPIAANQPPYPPLQPVTPPMSANRSPPRPAPLNTSEPPRPSTPSHNHLPTSPSASPPASRHSVHPLSLNPPPGTPTPQHTPQRPTEAVPSSSPAIDRDAATAAESFDSFDSRAGDSRAGAPSAASPSKASRSDVGGIGSFLSQDDDYNHPCHPKPPTAPLASSSSYGDEYSHGTGGGRASPVKEAASFKEAHSEGGGSVGGARKETELLRTTLSIDTGTVKMALFAAGVSLAYLKFNR